MLNVNIFNTFLYKFNLFVLIIFHTYNCSVIIMKTEINKKLGKRIQYLRQQRNISQERLAETIDIATTSLSYVETGRGFMTLNTLEKLAKALDVELYEIFQFSMPDTTEKMYEFILLKLKTIKNNDEKIKIFYNIIKNII